MFSRLRRRRILRPGLYAHAAPATLCSKVQRDSYWYLKEFLVPQQRTQSMRSHWQLQPWSRARVDSEPGAPHELKFKLFLLWPCSGSSSEFSAPDSNFLRGDEGLVWKIMPLMPPLGTRNCFLCALQTSLRTSLSDMAQGIATHVLALGSDGQRKVRSR